MNTYNISKGRIITGINSLVISKPKVESTDLEREIVAVRQGVHSLAQLREAASLDSEGWENLWCRPADGMVVRAVKGGIAAATGFSLAQLCGI